MPLNYSKWDQLELSDDSDIEGHPNVDKRSLIRWKQRDIHDKREARKHRIEACRAGIACNNVLAPRLDRIRARFVGKASDAGEANSQPQTEWAEDADDVRILTGRALFQHLVERLQTFPSPAAPPTNAKDQPTYDSMLLSLLMQVYDGVKSLPMDEQESAVLSGLDKHIVQLKEHTEKLENDLEAEIREQKKHITSEDIKEGFENKVCLRSRFRKTSLTPIASIILVCSPNACPSADQERNTGVPQEEDSEDHNHYVRSAQPRHIVPGNLPVRGSLCNIGTISRC